VIGITGTDGKTTTVNLIYHILHSSGKTVSMISTVGAVIHGEKFTLGFHVTNPASIALQKFLSKAAKNVFKDNYLVLEVTSHGLDQNRVWGIPFAIGGITNVTHEHLDYHKTYEAYVKAKSKLLRKAKITIVNADDASYPYIKRELKNKDIITYGKTTADITFKTLDFKSNLIGEYNTYNTLLAIAVCKQLGLTDREIKKGIETFNAPIGRSEIVHEDQFTVMIDFAHTPNAFMQLLSSIRPTVKGKLIHVFGSAGLRDVSKRPEMGEAASKFDDVIILTSEDPRSEDPKQIIEQIVSGMSKKFPQEKVFKIVNRQEAITKAISLAKRGDFILITGKAHEQSMNYGNGEKPWSEYEAVEKALRQAQGSTLREVQKT
jgi:UDP-N-acetylmuramoyl-L-alanyl-D-glutamate--2,6-diaminopimelate ligase